MEDYMIEITVRATSGSGKNTLASFLATILHNEGFDVVVDSSDDIKSEYATKERLHKIMQHTIISVGTELIPRQQMTTND